MKWIANSIVLSAAAVLFGACGGTNATTPSPSVTSIDVRATAAGAAAFQLNALAHISDGSTRDVTSSSQWQSSNASLATVSPAGAVSIVSDGEVEFRATYQTVTGTLRLLIGQAPLPTFLLSGTVREAGTELALAGARVSASGGSVLGAVATSDVNGRFSFSRLPSGTVVVATAKDGYQTLLNSTVTLSADTDVDVWLFAIAPLDSQGTPATARCRDASWTWTQTRAGACLSQDGVAYPVCPGPLCTSDTITTGRLTR